MLTVERREQLKLIIETKKTVTVAELAESFGVSNETIRRDFDALEKEGVLTKTYGGAVLKYRAGITVPTSQKLSVLVENKRAMAKEAAKYICPGDCIFLDHSTSVYYLCEEICSLPLTVLTNSMLAQHYLSAHKNINLVSTGGTYNHNESGFFGSVACASIKKHCVDKAFLSCRSIDIEKGIGDSHEEIATLRQNVIQSAAESSFLIVDHTKFDNVSFNLTAPLCSITHLITDHTLSPVWIDALERNHVKHITAQLQYSK